MMTGGRWRFGWWRGRRWGGDCVGELWNATGQGRLSCWRVPGLQGGPREYVALDHHHHHHHRHFICPIVQQYAHLHEYDCRRAGQQGCCHFLVDAFTLLHKRYLQYVKYDGSVTKCCAPLAALSPLGSGAIWQTIVERVTLRNQKLYESTTLLGNTNINKQICTAP